MYLALVISRLYISHLVPKYNFLRICVPILLNIYIYHL